MLKTIKIPKEAYDDANKLKKELEEGEVIEGIYNVKLTTAVSYAIKMALGEVIKRRKFLDSAGDWSDIDGAALIREVYSGRKKGGEWNIKLN